MKRYLIFAALAPPLGGFFVLLANTVTSGYWSHPPSLSETEKLVAVFVKTFQYSYLLGILPALMIGAVDDILVHFKTNRLGGPGPDRRRDRVCGDRIALRLPRSGQRRTPVHPLRPCRLYSGDDLFVAVA